MLRRFSSLLIIGLLLISHFAFFSSRSALAQDQVCYLFEVVLTNNDTVPLTGTIYFGDDDTGLPLTDTVSLTLNPGETGTLRLASFVPAGITVFPGGGPGGLDYDTFFFDVVDASNCGGGHIDDGRINAYDLGAPLAAYCKAGGMEVWDIDNSGHGTLAFTVTADQIAAGLSDAAASGQNQLIGEGLGNSLYALPSNQLTLVGPDVKEPGKTYEFVAPGDVCGT